MRSQEPFSNVVEAAELPAVVRLAPNLFAVTFSLMKLLPAHHILSRAAAAGQLRPETVVVESTSGTFGLALAMLCAPRRQRLILVSDPAIDDDFRRQLECLGAEVDIVRDERAAGGYQEARLERLASYRESFPDHFWPRQYDNPDNPRSYAKVAELLLESLGRIDCLVGTVGSGGSMCGTGRLLRHVFPAIQIVGVDTHGSVLFGLKNGKRLLRGLGNSLMPGNVVHSIFDEVHWVSAAEAFGATRELCRSHAMFQGPTSGAAFMVARWWAACHPHKTVVTMFPDSGNRYLQTVYNPSWLGMNGMLLERLPSEPVEVLAPAQATQATWTRINWARRASPDADFRAPGALDQKDLTHVARLH